jgi:phage-related protein
MVAALLVSGTFCGGQKGAVAPKVDAVKDLPAEAVAPLTDEAVVACVKALPGVGAALRAAKFSPPMPAEDAQIADVIAGFVEAMKPVPGIEDALKTAGTNWDEFRGTMLKIAAAQAAMSAEMLSGMIEEMKKDTTAAAKKSIAQIEALKTACAKVPAENKAMIQKHAADLEALKQLAKEEPAAPPPTRK